MRSTNFRTEDFFGDGLEKEGISIEQMTKLKRCFFSQNGVNIRLNEEFQFIQTI